MLKTRLGRIIAISAVVVATMACSAFATSSVSSVDKSSTSTTRLIYDRQIVDGVVQGVMSPEQIIYYSLDEGDLLTFVASISSDDPSDNLEIWSYDLPSGSTMPHAQGYLYVSSEFRWTPTFCQGRSATYDFEASYLMNGSPVATDFFVVTVNNVNRLPAFTTAPPEVKQIAVGSNWQETIAATDLDMTECGDDALTMTYNPVPSASGMFFEDQGNGNAVFDWTPTENEVGTCTITFEAHDQYGGICSTQVVVEVTEASCCVGRVGDANGSNEPTDEITLGDIMTLVDFLFITGPEIATLPECL